MLKDIFMNGAIIIASISIGNQILTNHEITPSAPFKIKLLFSSMSGLLGILLILNGIYVMPSVILDLRNIAIILTAIYCGFIPAIGTALIIAIFRVFYIGASFSSIIGAVTVLVVGFSCGFISTLTLNNLKTWVYMGSSILLISTLQFIILIHNHLLLINTLLAYWFGTCAILILAYFYVNYINLLKFTYMKYQLDSSRDHRTGLNNVRQFDDEIKRISKNLTDNSLITLFYLDIDFFKKINDVYGHPNGDKVLEDLGKILLSSSGSSDIVSRNGGEEFSVIMTYCPRDKVMEVAERIRTTVQDHKFCLIDGQMISLTISIGVAIYPETVNDINKIVVKADEALYQAKRTGRNKVVLAD